jgi:hypothetical protein
MLMLVGLVGIVISNEIQQVHLSPQLTPELVVQAFQKANYEIIDLREGSSEDYKDWYAPGGQLPERVLKFSTFGKTQAEPTKVLLLMFATDQQAEELRKSEEGLRECMGGNYGVTFRRGRVLMQPGRNLVVVKEFNALFRAASPR